VWVMKPPGDDLPHACRVCVGSKGDEGYINASHITFSAPELPAPLEYIASQVCGLI